MSAAEAAIPYEKQSDPQSNRTCGAACLSMVYRSFGKEVPQGKIWPAIAKENRFGSMASTTHLMAGDALNRGFSAIAMQAAHPLQTLRLCRESGIRAVINHRLNPNVPTGHFTVLVDIDDTSVVLHDPFVGPSRRLSHGELLELWQPRFPNSEIVGSILIGIAYNPPEVPACEFCHAAIPLNIECPNCKKPVGLQPGGLLGCISNGCIARMWNYICCPACDYTWTFGLQPSATEAATSPVGASRAAVSNPLASEAQPAPSAKQAAMTFDRLFAELDKFCNHIISIPAAANHPEIKQQLDFITSSKDKLRVAQAESSFHLKAHQEQLAKQAGEAKQREAAHRKKMEEVNRPAPPLDGNALGHALLKNLGFKH
jgi:hypothetical protein